MLLGGLPSPWLLVTLLDAMDDRFRSVEEMQSRLGLPLLTMIQRLQAAGEDGIQALVTHATPSSIVERGFPHAADGIDADASRCASNRGDQRRAGRRQDDQLANLAVCYAQARQTHAVDRRRPAAPGA